ncbi:DUF4381 domain-containing protein [Methylomonas sp. EFPC3]|uniref:DUF4381 domain-containing protein n=1 Tax=Methylomonas sp. EFPC3 TaxID=3021710 RepID=UPI002415BAF3|nr:DUF4381 domain-containing protein [Methylomonas sp. EFPC3]WFP48982.1 DUF4381 domain-containing protein [Methylomonas sp. EFPC3]
MEQLPLRDIHLPDAVDFWPPAPGWWALALLLPALMFGLRQLYQRIRRRSAVKIAGKLLEAMRSEPTGDARQTVAALSAWLRRVALSTAPRRDVASLSGHAWLQYLDRSLPDAPFTQGPGRCLADAHYRPQLPNDAELDALFELCERWLKQQAKKS